jgi:Flp pilus assembly protein TadB
LVAQRLPGVGPVAAGAIRIAGESGGTVADSFEAIALLASDEQELRDERKAATAQVRASALVISVLPVVLLTGLMASGRLDLIGSGGSLVFGLMVGGLLLIVVGLPGVYLIGCRSGDGSAARPASLVVLGSFVHPLLGAAAATVWMVGWRRRRAPSQAPSDLQVLAGTLVVGAAAGLSLQTSLERARAVVDPHQSAQLERVLRDGHQIGLGAALTAAEGSAAPLFGRLARAQVTGAPLMASSRARR